MIDFQAGSIEPSQGNKGEMTGESEVCAQSLCRSTG